jgi:hypothetical protein
MRRPIEDPTAAHFSRVVFVVEQMGRRIYFLERAISLLVLALVLMTVCNGMIILRVFFGGSP